eukprot:6387827-Pyramimonas_sp.AAC.1
MGEASFKVRTAFPCCLAVATPPQIVSSSKSKRMNAVVLDQVPCAADEVNCHADAVSPSGVQQP